MRDNLQRRALATPRASERSKRAAILEAAIDQFGRQGFDGTRWAEVARYVGIGQPALYYYFESKAHCLFTIIAETLGEARERFETATVTTSDIRQALEAAILKSFELSDDAVLRRRIVIAERQRLAVIHAGKREEEARHLARERVREIEVLWVGLLARGMERGVFVQQDPGLLARAVLGLLNSVWEWYRPSGSMRLEEVGAFYRDCCLRMVLK